MKILREKNSLLSPKLALIFAVSLAAISCTGANTNENANAKPTSINAGGAPAANSAAVNSAPTNAAPANVSATTNTATANSANVAAGGEPPTPIDPDMPADVELQNLIKTTLLDFNSAIQSGSFESFHSSASAYFQQQYTPAQLQQKFGEFIGRKVDIGGISSKQAVVKPTLQDQNGIKVLNVTGNYPNSAVSLFDLQFIQEDIEWKLLSINNIQIDANQLKK